MSNPPRHKIPEFMMPVMADAAALQFFTEAMRANTSMMEAFRKEACDDRRLLNDIHTRVVRIEAQNVSDLTGRVDSLESERDKVHGARNLGNWMIDKLPSLSAIIIAVLIAIFATLKATGRI